MAAEHLEVRFLLNPNGAQNAGGSGGYTRHMESNADLPSKEPTDGSMANRKPMDPEKFRQWGDAVAEEILENLRRGSLEDDFKPPEVPKVSKNEDGVTLGVSSLI